MNKFLSGMLLLLVMGMDCQSAFGNPVHYRLDFGVTTIISDPSSAVKVGDVFHGFFTVDSAILRQDGLNKGGDVSAFRIQMLNSNFNFNSPSPQSDFLGFRGPGGLFSNSPGFDVSYGEIVNLRGGVFGSGDARFVDFSPTFSNPGGPNTFNAQVAGGAAIPGISNFSALFQGTMAVRRLSEPPAFVLVVTGILLIAVWQWRRYRKIQSGKAPLFSNPSV